MNSRMVLMVACWRYRISFSANGCVSTLVNVDWIKWTYFRANEFQVGVMTVYFLVMNSERCILHNAHVIVNYQPSGLLFPRLLQPKSLVHVWYIRYLKDPSYLKICQSSVKRYHLEKMHWLLLHLLLVLYWKVEHLPGTKNTVKYEYQCQWWKYDFISCLFWVIRIITWLRERTVEPV